MRHQFRLTGAIVALVAVFVIAPAASASSWVTYRQSGTNAFAFDGSCTDNPDGTVSCESRSIDVFKGMTKETGEPGRHTAQVCYGESTETFDPDTGEGEFEGSFGCTFGAPLTVDKLRSLTLADTAIELTHVACDQVACTETPGGSTTVSGAWTGVGPTFSQRDRFRFDDGSCVQVNADKGRFREASFEGSFAATESMMGAGTFRFRTNCPF
jgi:hypothetical protein